MSYELVSTDVLFIHHSTFIIQNYFYGYQT